MPLPSGVRAHERVLEGKVWYGSNSSLFGLNVVDTSTQSIQNPLNFKIGNPEQKDHTFIGSAENTVYQFDAKAGTWETLFSVPDGQELVPNLSLNASDGLLPLVTALPSSKIQSIVVLDLKTKKTRELPALAVLLVQHPFTVISQPKVFVQKDENGAQDTILAIYAHQISDDARNILIYSIHTQQFRASIPLEAGNEITAYKLGNYLALKSSNSLYGARIEVFNPYTAKALWNQTATNWTIEGSDLFSTIDPFLGGYRKIHVHNGETQYDLPGDVDLSTVHAFQDGYCFAGRAKADDREGNQDHLVILSEAGCEVFRGKITYNVSSLNTWIYDPSSNYLVIPGAENLVYVCRPE